MPIMLRKRVSTVYPVAGMLVAIAGSLWLPPSSASAVDDYCNANPYGIDGNLSEQEVQYMSYIAFPQTSADMRGTFGSPACFDEKLDYYRIEGTAGWLAVEFQGPEAVGYRIWEGPE